MQRNLPSIQNRPLKATITFVGKQLEWMVAAGCATAMSIGINEACTKIEEGEYDVFLSESGWALLICRDLQAFKGSSRRLRASRLLIAMSRLALR